MSNQEEKIREDMAQPDQPEVINRSTPPDLDRDAYYKGLSEEDKDSFNNILKIEEHLPKGYTICDAVEDRARFGDIYLLPLPSGVYVYRPLQAREDKEIKEIKGLTAEVYRDQVVTTCVISPTISMMTIKEHLAGTIGSLHDNILISSDFSTMETAPIKI